VLLRESRTAYRGRLDLSFGQHSITDSAHWITGSERATVWVDDQAVV
jgi:hypothetical protein